MRATTLAAVLLAALPGTFSIAAEALPDEPKLADMSAKPRHYAFLLTPSVTPIDLFGPLDVFTGLAMHLAMEYANSTGPMYLSFISPNKTSSTTNPPVHNLQFGAALVPTITFDEYDALRAQNFQLDDSQDARQKENAQKGPIDVLLIPGGGGTRMDVTKEVAFTKAIYPSLQYAISVCTGSTILARAGVLDGRHATTNKKAWTWATSFGTNVTYVPQARWVRDGNVYTGSGVSAAIDTAYAFVSDVFGEATARYVADSSEYNLWPHASYDPFAERWGAGKGVV